MCRCEFRRKVISMHAESSQTLLYSRFKLKPHAFTDMSARKLQTLHPAVFLTPALCVFSQHPYPSEEQKKQLSQDTGLTILQVNNWSVFL